MNLTKYLNRKCNFNGDIISSLILEISSNIPHNNILFVRTHTTGIWLNNLFINNSEITKVLYDTNCLGIIDNSNNPIIIGSDLLEEYLLSLNKKFDLICIDTCHEYNLSLRDFNLVSSLLSDSGILISHDCYPSSKRKANPRFILGPWCGETYIAFIELAYNNPNWYYGVLNTDTGIGILCKKQFDFLSNKLDINKQKQLLYLHKNYGNPYSYFVENAKDVINAISI